MPTLILCLLIDLIRAAIQMVAALVILLLALRRRPGCRRRR
jgi:hypothetical protein